MFDMRLYGLSPYCHTNTGIITDVLILVNEGGREATRLAGLEMLVYAALHFIGVSCCVKASSSWCFESMPVYESSSTHFSDMFLSLPLPGSRCCQLAAGQSVEFPLPHWRSCSQSANTVSATGSRRLQQNTYAHVSPCVLTVHC